MSKFTINEKVLADDFYAKGNDINELRSITDAFEENTIFKKMMSTDIELLSYIGKDVHDITRNGVVEKDANVIKTICLTPGTELDITMPLNQNIRLLTSKTGVLMNELADRTKIGIQYTETNGSRRFYYTSGNALQTMDRFGMSGDFLLVPCIERDILIAKQFGRDLGVTAVIRHTDDGSKNKIFTLLSDKYTNIAQHTLYDIIEKIEKDTEIGTAKCYEWEISNFFTKLYIEFPDKATELSGLYGLPKTMIPGIMFTTSDTGDASFSVKGTWRIAGSRSVSVHTEVKRKHIGDIDINQIIEDVSNDIFAEYAKLPEALCNLMLQDITDPTWDLKTSAGIKANQAEIENVLKNAFKSLNVVKAIGKKCEKVLRQSIVDELDPSIRYTAYDICMLMMSLPERASFSDKNKDISMLQKNCGNAAFIEYVSKEDTVVLTA